MAQPQRRPNEATPLISIGREQQPPVPGAAAPISTAARTTSSSRAGTFAGTLPGSYQGPYRRPHMPPLSLDEDVDHHKEGVQIPSAHDPFHSTRSYDSDDDHEHGHSIPIEGLETGEGGGSAEQHSPQSQHSTHSAIRPPPALPRTRRLYSGIAASSQSFAKHLQSLYTTLYSPRVQPLPLQHSLDDIQNFLKEFSHALLRTGLPSHAVVFYVQMAGQRFNYTCRVQVTSSSSLLMSFGADSAVHMVMVDNPTFSLSKMVDVTQAAEEFLSGSFGTQETLKKFDAISKEDHFSSWWMVPNWALFGGLCAPLFKGGIPEMIAATILGLVMGALAMGSSNRHIARSSDILMGVVAALFATITNAYFWAVNGTCVMLCGVLWALPGFRLTLAMSDVAAGHTVTGTAKIVSAFVTALNIGFGIIGGLKINSLYFNSDMSGESMELPYWFTPICVCMSGIPLAVLLDANLSHLPQLLIGMMVAYFTCSLASHSYGLGFGSWLGAFVLGLLSNLYSWVTRFPSFELSLFAIMMLVPGSISVRGVLESAQDVSGAMALFSDVISVALALVAGLFTANLALPPLRAL